MDKSSYNGAMILCVEDEETLRRDIADELVEAGYRVIEAGTGKDALAQLLVTKPDLILCDVTMPDMDGYALLHTLQAEPKDYADIPFIFLSALADRRDVVEGKMKGADDYLTKPVDFDLLLATVHARLRQISKLRTHAHGPGGKIEAQLSSLIQTVDQPIDSGFAAVLDLISTAIILVGSDREICFANRLAKASAATTPALGLEPGNFTIQSSRTNGFSIWLDQMLAQNDDDNNVSYFTLYSEEEEDEYRIVGCRLENKMASGPKLALFIAPSRKVAELAPQPLEALFGLTPTESVIAVGLARGEKSAEIATALSIAQTTVAFHIRNIFQKTGVCRQASLVALLLTSPAGLL